KNILKKLKPLRTKKPPFNETPDINKPSRFRPDPPHATAYWVKPKIVCEVSFAEMTNDGVMRHPSFEGLRIDKNAAQVVKETAKSTKKLVEKKQPSKKQEMVTKPAASTRKTLLNPHDETQVRKINGHDLK